MIKVSLIVAAACAAVASAQEELGARGFTNGEPVYEGEERMLMPSQQLCVIECPPLLFVFVCSFLTR